MAAEIIENQEGDPQAQTDTIPNDTEALSPEQLVEEFSGADTTAAEPQQTVEDELPEKYRGKSIQEVVGMHQEAERLVGKQGSEVGELRKIVDSYITAQAAQLSSQAAPEAQPEEVDFFEDPQKAVSNAISQHPDVKKAQELTQDMQRQQSQQKMVQEHPDAGEVLKNPAFATWVQSSPIRTELFVRADQQYDFDAANELLSSWKERNQVAQQAQKAEVQQRKQAVAQASTGGGSGVNTSGSKRVYRRADIIKLMKNDPDRYEALSGEIMQAYAEGRVR